MTVTWFSDGQPSYNAMVDIDTNMFNHVSTLFTTAWKALPQETPQNCVTVHPSEILRPKN